MKLPLRHAALTHRRNFSAVGGIARALKYVAVCLSITALALPGGPTLVSATTPTNGLAIASIQPTAGQVVGVAEPLTVSFAEPVLDRAAAERTLNITASNGHPGRVEGLKCEMLQGKPRGLWAP